MSSHSGDYVDRWMVVYADVIPERVADLEEHFAPDSRSLRVPYPDVRDADPQLASDLLDQPKNLLSTAAAALRQHSDTIDHAVSHGGEHAQVNVRVNDLPEERHFRVGKYRTRDLGGLVAVRGTVVDVEPVVPNVEVAAWECQRCGELVRTHQQYGDMIKPAQCPRCENKGPFQLVQDESDLVDFQELYIMPVETSLDEPPGLPVYLKDDLTGTLGKDDSETFVGRYEVHPQQNETQLKTYLETVDIKEADDREAGIDAERLRRTFLEYVETNQSEGKSWGVDREDILDAVMSEQMRQKEVEDIVDELIDEGKLKNPNGSKIVRMDT
jgi:replicative DNA helicase Mcm